MINIKHPKTRGKPPVNRPNAVQEKADCNQNVECSFEQLCNMINDLEKNIVNEMPEVENHLQLEPEKDNSDRTCGGNGTTYDDIMSFLTKFEETGPLDEKLDMVEVDAATMLREMLEEPQGLSCLSCDSANVEDNSPYTFKEDLATARLQLEEKNATVSLLKEQLRSERKLACDKLEAQKRNSACKLQQQEDKYKGIVKRHQKFIEQLISEKTELTEKCNSLVQRVKEIETKMQRDLKAAAERHAVELQRAKDRYAAAEKIKRERWIEARTTKIKEMTVKGLESELHNMMEQHAEEIQRLRNVHMKELQDVELRTIRRSNEQLEQLRLELTASQERMMTNEKNLLWTRYKEKLEEQESQFKAQQGKLLEELQLERENLSKERGKWEAEKEAALEQMHLRYQEETELLKQRHLNEKKVVEESLKMEWEAWLADYKRQQNLRIEQAESKIREECDKERDRQIELVIERFEKHSRDAKLTLQQNFDRNLRYWREKLETSLQAAIDAERSSKEKLILTKEKLEKVEIQLQQTENKLRQCLSELNDANEVIQELRMEKDQAKKLARQEIEGEKRELEEKIASLYQEITRINSNKDASMSQLHSRIKLIMTQKVLTIKNLTKELDDAKRQSEHLEKLLDQQRREYILKSL
ncbi:centrosomal protein of 131 kDa isoform X1 [Osmia bicornis bicornis]|uniref:centrosomal protein of 131 kDa isoform X1 n=3 Tax=Osmia bicornis bicornis TaxID=1437191 RepID=UPI0010F832D1|nr:centrosomal protein of 131 kDa isoform X1 [Osmia bicornis bicornis]